MTCSAFCKRHGERQISVRGVTPRRPFGRRSLIGEHPYDPATYVPEMLGTWDYKWPLGAEIRVAFQRPPEVMGVSPAAFREARQIVESTAARWHDAVWGDQYAELRKHLPKLKFLQAEAELFEAPLGPTHSITDQHRSPFRKDDRIEYDVLFSLEDLPVTRADPFRGFGEELESIVIPTSEIGSYARRVDYAAPTAYIGRYGRFKHDQKLDLCSYLRSTIGQHTIVHIFGHVLGLAHAHQHPTLVGDVSQREAFYVSADEAVELMRGSLGVDADLDMVTDNLFDVWPGDLTFSDWVEYSEKEKAEHRATGTVASVMAPPYYRALIQGQPRTTEAIDQLLAEAAAQPGVKDLETLRLMYDPRPLPNDRDDPRWLEVSTPAHLTPVADETRVLGKRVSRG